jgi:hypothetical protein
MGSFDRSREQTREQRDVLALPREDQPLLRKKNFAVAQVDLDKVNSGCPQQVINIQR